MARVRFLRTFGKACVAFSAVLSLFGPGATTQAQTAPQLLPYTVKRIAGGGTVGVGTGSTPVKAGGTCPSSGFTATDAYGDGCLATEILLTGPRTAAADKNGNIFFTDYTNGLVRRVDVLTGVVTAVAGGAASNPASGASCGAYKAADAKGNGCLGTSVVVSRPLGLVISPAGDLYFSEEESGTTGAYLGSDVRKVAATNGLIQTTVNGTTAYTGPISLVAGNVSSTEGYASGVNAASASYLDTPYGLAFDTSGDLFITEEYRSAILVVNTNASGTNTVNNIPIGAGQIVKIAGASSPGNSTCPNGSATSNKCAFGVYSNGAVANASEVDDPYAVAVDGTGATYFANEFTYTVAKISSGGTLNTYTGQLSKSGKATTTRAQAGSFATGNPLGLAADTNSNIYFTDGLNGVIWRVDGAGQQMYPIAGGATTTCSTAGADTLGNGCPGTQATFGKTTSGTATSSTTGVFGVTVDANSNIYLGDTITNEVREVASGTQFGAVGNGSVTQTLEVHFAAGDGPAASAYQITSGGANFSAGSATCTANSDGTTDCLLPVTATPTVSANSVNQQFTGTLQVTSLKGGVGTFPLSGTLVSSPVTRTAIAASPQACNGTTTFTSAVPVVLTATVNSTGSPTGTIAFYSNGNQIGTPQTVSGGVATLTYTFPSAGSYTVTAIYSGDSYFKTSTTASAAAVTVASPTFAPTLNGGAQSTVTAGQTALYNLTLNSVYNGTISFACSGLPQGSSCIFSPTSITATGCSTGYTVALSINTQGSVTTLPAGVDGTGRGRWGLFSMLAGAALAMFVGAGRSRFREDLARTGLFRSVLTALMGLGLLAALGGTLACSSAKTTPGTPAGSYQVMVTATGSAGTTTTMSVPLVVH